ncbi:MAG: TolC family protein [Rhodocyclaceae bacterium]
MYPIHLLAPRARTVACCVATLTLVLTPAWSPAALADSTPPGATLGADLAALIAHAREHNPALVASRLDAAAARARVASASSLPDPRLELELMDVTNTMNPGRSTSLLPGEVGTTTLRVTQMLPFPGKRALRGEIAEALADGTEADVAQARLNVETAIRQAFITYFRAVDQARILAQTIALNEGLETLVLDRYALGLASQQAVLQVQGELTALRIEAVELARRRAAAQASLNVLLPRAPDATLAEPAALPPLPPSAALTAMIEQASRHAPALGRSRAELAAAERSRDLTYRERYPDFGVSIANNRPRSGRESWDVMFELNIPLQQASRRAREREADHARAAAEARRDAAEHQLAGAVGEAHAALEARRAQIALIRDGLLPQTEAGLASARAGYETGSVDFAAVLAAQQRVLNTRRALLEAEVEAALDVATLEQLLGVSL